MKRVILSLLAATALTTAGVAADLPSRKVAPAYIPPVFSWTGFYAGVNAGYAFNGSTNLKNVTYGVGGYSYTANNGYGYTRHSDEGSFTGGAQIGYNYQMGSIVLGAEADFNYANVEKKHYSDGLAYLYTGDEAAVKSQVQWFGTVRARVGFTPVDRLMLFVTGGLAYGQVKTTGAYYDNVNSYGFVGSKNDTRVGWTLGAGAEYAITNNITIKGEYAYVDLGDKRHTVGGLYTTEYLTWKDQNNFHVVRAGVNYKF